MKALLAVLLMALLVGAPVLATGVGIMDSNPCPTCPTTGTVRVRCGSFVSAYYPQWHSFSGMFARFIPGYLINSHVCVPV